MKISSLVTAILILLLAAAPVAADAVDQKALLLHLDKSRTHFLESVDGLSDAQLAYKAAEDRWSITEVIEHLALAETLIRDNVTEVLNSEPTTEAAAKEDQVMKVMADRSQKFQAPEPVQPAERWDSAAAALKAFRQERQATLELVEDADDLRSYVGEHPAFGPLDAYSWLIFLSSHVERHTAQIEEVKVDAGFPKS